jgi:rhodanese-related sulfurtransferase
VILNDILKNPQGNKFRDRTVFVCAAGNRSAIASEMAVALGTKDVVNFRGGTDAWREAGLPLEKP